MTVKQLGGRYAPDGGTYITVTDGAGNLLSPVTSSSLGAGVSTALAAATNTSGGVATVAVGATSWTPADASGAGLTFTSVNAQYTQIGNIVTAYGALTYPSTTSASAAAITLPIAVPNQTYATVFSAKMIVSTNSVLKTIVNSTTATIVVGAGGTPISNSSLSLSTINFLVTYPVT